jgi:hypothetical protein
MCIAGNFKMELFLRQYIFRHRQVINIFIDGLFILAFESKK